jgi:hypothetical protein
MEGLLNRLLRGRVPPAEVAAARGAMVVCGRATAIDKLGRR